MLESLDPHHLFGRSAERAQVRAAWALGARFVTLVGPPGAGKTRIARALGGRFVDLSAARDEAAVCRVMAAALGVALGDGDEAEARARIARGLAPGLVVLDNLEQLVEVLPALLAGWSVPGVQWLGTSRRPVGVAGEVRVWVGGLPEAEAMALFCARARAAGVLVEVGAELSALVQALDGLPLALELAAARTPLLSLAELRRRVAADPRVLDGEAGAGLARALAASWALLSPAHTLDLQALSLFCGPFELAAAAATLGRDEPAALEVLARLQASGWLRVERGPQACLYVGVRAFVRAQGEDPAAAERYARWHGAEGERLWRALRGPAPVAALDGLARLAEDLQAVVEQAARYPEAAAGAAIGLHALTCDRGPWHNGTAILDAALAVQAVGAPARIELMGLRGMTRALRGNYAVGEADLEAALALAEDTQQPARSVAPSLSLREPLGEGALEVNEAGPPRGRASASLTSSARITWVLGILGPIRRFMGRHDEAEALAHREVELARAHGLRRETARGVFNLAGALLLQGRWLEADVHWQAAREEARAVGDARLAALCLSNRAFAAFEGARFDETEALLSTATAELLAAEVPTMVAKLIALRVRLAVARDEPDAEARIAAGRLEATRLCDAELAVDLEVAAARLAEHRQQPDAPARATAARALAGQALSSRLDRPLPSPALPFDREGRWLVTAKGTQVDLTRRPVLRRVLAALARGPLSVPELVEVAWAGERIHPEAAANRVYTAVRALRRLGAPITTDAEGGYRLSI